MIDISGLLATLLSPFTGAASAGSSMTLARAEREAAQRYIDRVMRDAEICGKQERRQGRVKKMDGVK